MTAIDTAAEQTVTADAVAGALVRALEQEADRVERGRPRSRARTVALTAAPKWDGPEEITAEHENRHVRVRVAAAPTVLAVLDRLSRPLDGADYQVLLTPCTGEELGPALLGRLLGGAVNRVNNWELLLSELNAFSLDPRLYSRRWGWLADALRDIRATTALNASGGLIRLEEALRVVTAVRFGKDKDDRIDAAALLDWTRDHARVGRFAELRDDERDGLRAELEAAVGPVARVVFLLLDKGQVYDALPTGLVLAELLRAQQAGGTAARDAWLVARERFFGSDAPDEYTLSRFGDACEAAVLRMMDGDDHRSAAEIGGQAEQILGSLGAESVARGSGVLTAGLDARLSALGQEIAKLLRPDRVDTLAPQDLADVEDALENLRRHRRFSNDGHDAAAALAAVRLLRWAAGGHFDVRTVAEGAAAHIDETGWVDRAATTVRFSRTEVPSLTDAYTRLYARVRHLRGEFDRSFAQRVAAWTGSYSRTDRQLRAENLLHAVARPLAEHQAPLIVVLDGMSAEVAVQLGEQIAALGRFAEIGRGTEDTARREGALSTLPSVTTCSRSSLLSGALQTGGQSKERSGFTRLWGQPGFGGRDAALFYQRDLDTAIGQSLPQEVVEAVAAPETAVAAVINVVDDALAKDRGDPDPEWHLERLGKLLMLLDAAARAGCPVLLTSDHGHVWDRGENQRTRDGESARYRTGTPEDGEVEVSGDRVLAGGGTVVVPWDERIRYTDRKEGYHGGISAAEVVIPVLALLPLGAPLPKGFSTLRTAQLEPAWWSRPLAGSAQQRAAEPPPAAPAADSPPKAAASAKRGGRRKSPTPAQDTVLFGETRDSRSLGTRVIETDIFEFSRSHVHRAPDAAKIAKVVDALAESGGARPRLNVGHVAAAAGESATAYRAVRFLKMVKKVLNIEGFPVLELPESERAVELNVELLKRQFLPGGG
ncbi:BREX-2 system phosphatase PglZ [Streptomonospora wellingtoniae]|uniref:BREX-2 system phosphatase PglZ n=1 Tax=Streptomonospora wellingtoniae TaxID=3075544 RepID=A0ABU2KY72_9ACTN|nr:BREX-2 system phosphatase PglZ [Streptomonospora sp. DSM 45055]MDT0304251.1 BREX-2 system phosphatase PglZ [Streptomonospora sp. DSM 45055]